MARIFSWMQRVMKRVKRWKLRVSSQCLSLTLLWSVSTLNKTLINSPFWLNNKKDYLSLQYCSLSWNLTRHCAQKIRSMTLHKTCKSIHIWFINLSTHWQTLLTLIQLIFIPSNNKRWCKCSNKLFSNMKITRCCCLHAQSRPCMLLSLRCRTNARSSSLKSPR